MPEQSGTAQLFEEKRELVVRGIVALMHEGTLSWHEMNEHALILCTNGQGSPYFIGRENFSEDGETMYGSAPLTPQQILAKVDAWWSLPFSVRVKARAST